MCVPLVPEVDANPSQRVLDDAFTEQIGKNTTFKAMRADGALPRSPTGSESFWKA
jgi:hypothetical protein